MDHTKNQISKLNIGSTKVLAYRLGVGHDELLEISQHAGGDYAPFSTITEPPMFAKIPFQPKERRIDKPILAVKDIQSRINRRLLRNLNMPDHICGGVKGKTLLHNITPHLGAGSVVTLDIKSFFPNITTFQVYNVWRQLLGCSPKVAELLTRITTFERSLPQGAPTSSALANLVLFTVDEPIRVFCSQHGVTYTTWVDDLVFSGSNCRQVIAVAVVALRAGGFSVPHRKMKIMSGPDQKLVTGVLVGEKPGVSRKYVRNTRSAIHKLRSGAVPPSQIDGYIQKIRGRIAHVNRLNPNRARELEYQLQSVST